jgi:DNA-binding transcriptional ArsR family regulator
MINAMVNDLDATLAALADPTRRRVVELLRSGGLPAREVARGAGVTRAAMSRHLRVLRSAGLVTVETPEHDARERLYQLRPDHFVALGAWLDQLQAFWSEQLGAFKQHAEKQAGELR